MPANPIRSKTRTRPRRSRLPTYHALAVIPVKARPLCAVTYGWEGEKSVQFCLAYIQTEIIWLHILHQRVRAKLRCWWTAAILEFSCICGVGPWTHRHAAVSCLLTLFFFQYALPLTSATILFHKNYIRDKESKPGPTTAWRIWHWIGCRFVWMWNSRSVSVWRRCPASPKWNSQDFIPVAQNKTKVNPDHKTWVNSARSSGPYCLLSANAGFATTLKWAFSHCHFQLF